MPQPVTAGSCINKEQGYYFIWITEISKLPFVFREELKKRNSQLLYIGIAETTVHKRLLLQELQHKNPATFFRSIGAVLGYQPDPGSLIGKSNQNNYRFSKNVTSEIIDWNDKNLEIAFCCVEQASRTNEIILIKKHAPLFNWTHNPVKFMPLKIVKNQCLLIARGSNR